MSLVDELMDKIAEIIDMKSAYRIIRRPYDKEFAEANNVEMEDISSNRFIPCLMCGTDTIPRSMLSGSKRTITFCSKECRSKHGVIRLIKFDESTDIRATAKELVKLCLNIDVTNQETDVKKKTTPLVVRKLLSENNRLLELILEELKRGNRPT
jgi:hypothetical protein